MLRALRKSGGSTTWKQPTAQKKSKRDVSDVTTGDNILSEGGEMVYLQDLAHVMTLYPGVNRAHKHKRQPVHRYQTFGAGAFIDPAEPPEIFINVAFVPISNGTSAGFLSAKAQGGAHDDTR
jgi:hypothetical protein